MDPSIMRLLEDDEDETMHSGAEVEAFQAALNRDIGGDALFNSQSSQSVAVMSQGSSSTSNSLPPQMQAEGSTQSQSGSGDSKVQQDIKYGQHQGEQTSQVEVQRHSSLADNQLQRNDVNIPARPKQSQEDNQKGQVEQASRQIPQTSGLPAVDKNPAPKVSNQPGAVSEPASNQVNRGKQVPFALLLPVLLPQLDKDRAMQLQALFNKLKRNEMNKDDFIRLMRSVVGDQMLRLAVNKVQAQSAPNHFQLHSSSSARQLPQRMQSVGAGSPNFSDPRSFAQLHQKGVPSPAVLSHIPSSAAVENSAQVSREVADGSGSQLPSVTPGAVNQDTSIPVQGVDKQQQHHLHFQQKPYPMYGSSGSSYHPYSGTNINPSTPSLKPQPHESQMRQIPQNQGMGSGNLVGEMPGTSMVSASNFDIRTSVNDPNKAERGSAVPVHIKEEYVEKQASKIGFPTSASVATPTSTAGGPSTVSPNATGPADATATFGSRVSSAPAANNRTPAKKPSAGQKKLLEAAGSSPPPSSNKKQKVSGAFLDQSIEQLNDVTAVSGVNIREEEEQLFSGAKEESRASEASRRVVQEEEERLILQRIPLQKKLAEIVAKCGLKNISNDVERCLSLCVEERLRNLITNLIRISKQRVDAEKPRHRTVITSDVRQQIMAMNRKARDEWEKKQAEAEKLRKQNEPEDNNGTAGDKEKDEGRGKAVKANKEEDDKMRTTAANVAARAAVGGDDMLSKWQLMAEQARQKREGGADASSGSQPGKDASRRPLSGSGRTVKDNQEAEKKGVAGLLASSGGTRRFGRNQVNGAQARVARSISVKDVIAVLEREPQMSKSSMIFRLYEKIRSEGTGESSAMNLN